MRMPSLLLLALAALGSQATEDILKPEEAFRYALSASDDAVEVRWQIEPGHYLYKQRMGYRSLSDGLLLGEPQLPPGKPYEDEFFGRMEVYRDEVRVRLPIISRDPGIQTAKLEIRSQGCADIGLCYPPQKWIGRVSFDGSGGALERLLGGTGNRVAAGEPLPPEEAFRARLSLLDPFRLAIDWDIEPGYYLYRHSLAVNTVGGPAQAGRPRLPAGTAKQDEHFGETEVYYDAARIEVPLSRATPAPGVLELDIAWQGCKEDSICYPPQLTRLAIDLPSAGNGTAPAAPVSEQDRLSQLIVSADLALVIATFMGLGLLLAFTPCVLPMVPILSGIIAGQGKDVTTGRAFALSLTYVLGMAFSYTLAGAAFAAAGGQLQAALQKPWIIIAVAGLFVALAASMFGAWELQMPAAIQNRISGLGNRQRSGTFIGTAILGALSAVVVTTCVAPPLVASLMVIAKTGDMLRGALSLFAMSLGMGIPLLIVGTSAGRLLPKAGAWMNKVKGAFGFLMLGLAVWMLERILPAPLTVALYGVLVFVAGVFLGAFNTLLEDAPVAARLGKGFGLLAALYGTVLLIGALGGARDPLQPLQFAMRATERDQQALRFERIKTLADLDAVLLAASSAGRPVMLDFYADWCVSCKEMERDTFTDAAVQAALGDALLLQADVTANDAADQALLQRFGIFGPPTILFFDAAGRERQAYRVVGYMPAEEFARHAGAALHGS